MQNIIYIGAFVSTEELEKKLMENHIERKSLFRAISNPHVTAQFRPESVDETLFGREVNIRVIGYGVNDQNEGLLVEVSCTNEEVQALFEKVAEPHITLSVSEHGKPVNTRYVDFAPVEHPFVICGVFDAFRK